MPFVNAKSPKYFAPARYNTLDADGVLLENKFDLQFKRHTTDQLEELDKMIKARAKVKGARVDREVLQAACVGWRAVQDEGGTELPFSLDALDTLEQDFPGFIKCCVEAFYLSTQPTQSAHLATKN